MTPSISTGPLRWEQKVESGFIASPAVRDGRLYLGDIDGKFHCLEAATGRGKVEFRDAGGNRLTANFYQDKVLVGSQDATLYCLQAGLGELVWKYSIGDQIRCSPTIAGDRVFLAGCDGRLHVIDLTKGHRGQSRSSRRRV